MGIATLKRRTEFQRVRGGARCARKCLLVEGRGRGESDRDPARFGFTITRKIGTAVVRNRIRRRLKALIAGFPPGMAVAGSDYVIVARDCIAGLTYAELGTELATAFGHVNRGLANPGRAHPNRPNPTRSGRPGASRPKSPA